MTDYATLVYDIDSSGADGAARALAGLNRYAAATATMSAKLEKQLRGTNGQFVSQSQYIAENEDAIRRLAASYNPVLSAQLRFAEVQKEIARAVQLGVITSDQQANALRLAQVEMTRSIGVTDRWGRGFQNSGHHVQNASYQIGDFFVQVASGQNVMMALSQQLPQLLGGFGILGAAAGAAAAILGAAWMVMGNGESAAEKLNKSLTALGGAIDEVRSLSASVSLAGLDALREKYGQVDAQVMRLVENQRLYNQLVASTELRESLQVLADMAGSNWYDIGISEFAAGAVKLQSVFSITRNDAESLKAAFDDIGRAKGLQAQQAALAKTSEYLRIILSNTENVTEEQLATYKAVNDSLDAVTQLLSLSGRLPGVFENAASAASRITDELNRAVSAAARLAASAISDVKFAQIELDFRTDKVGKAAAIAAAKFDSEVGKAGMDTWLYNSLRQQAIDGAVETAKIMGQVEVLNEADREAAKKSKGGGGGKGAAELKAAQTSFQSLSELMEQNTLFEYAEYNKRQTQLDVALSKKLLSEQNYNLMKSQLQTLYFGTEYEKQGLQFLMEQQQLDLALEQRKISEQRHSEEVSRIRAAQQNAALSGYETFFGNMASAAQAGGDRATGIVKAFSVAQGLLNSYLAYTQVLADPSLIGRPFLRQALAASTLAAGLAQVANMGGGGAKGKGSASATATSAAKQEPTRNVLIRLQGDDWLTSLAESMMTQIYEGSKNGRVIIARDF